MKSLLIFLFVSIVNVCYSQVNTAESISSNSLTCEPDSFFLESIYGNNHSWVTLQKYYNTFDQNGNLVTQLLRTPSMTGHWKNSDLNLRNYNLNNDLVSSVWKSWNSSDSLWENSSRRTYTYSPGFYLLEWQTELWNLDSNYWDKSSRIINSYDVSNNLIGELTQEFDISNNTWGDYVRRTYSYNSTNKVSGSLTETWDVNINAWVNNNKRAFWYSNNYVTNTLNEVWYMGAWKYVSKDTTIYDTNYNILNYATMIWGSDSTWTNYSKSIKTYDVNDNKVTELDQSWLGSFWSDKYKRTFYTNCTRPISTVGIANNEQVNGFNIYPNPVVTHFSVDSESDYKSIELINALGVSVYQSNEKKLFDISELQSGVYIVILTNKDGKTLQKKKVIKY